MQPATIATLDTLEKAEWFSRVGTPESLGIDDPTRVIVVGSWAEAIAHCGSLEWQNLCLEAWNQYRTRLLERSKARLNQWNEIAIGLKKTTIPFVRRKIERVVREQALPKVFEDAVQWDILGVCMEAEYADVYPPGFYAANAFWYVEGRFPCGWQGEFPKGTLIIY